MSQGAFAFYGLRRLAPCADAFFGGRINYLSTNLRINSPLQVRSVDGSKTWFDPIVGLPLQPRLGDVHSGTCPRTAARHPRDRAGHGSRPFARRTLSVKKGAGPLPPCVTLARYRESQGSAR
jgi:hypothetical protein